MTDRQLLGIFASQTGSRPITWEAADEALSVTQDYSRMGGIVWLRNR